MNITSWPWNQILEQKLIKNILNNIIDITNNTNIFILILILSLLIFFSNIRGRNYLKSWVQIFKKSAQSQIWLNLYYSIISITDIFFKRGDNLVVTMTYDNRELVFELSKPTSWAEL